MFRAASGLLGQGFFNPSWGSVLSVYPVHVVILAVFAMAAMILKRAIDPGSDGQRERWKAINEGKGEKIFISLAGSIATSILFTFLTAATFSLVSGMLAIIVELTLPVVFLAALFNIAAGLAASLVVGVIFLVAKVGKKGG
jgi:O-antigen ligase